MTTAPADDLQALHHLEEERMTEDQDNAGEVVTGAVRVALTAAGQLAEQAARRREADLRAAERGSAARVAMLQSQLATEREMALRSVRDVVQRGDSVTVDEVIRAWEQARSWDNPTMGLERAQLEERIRQQFGVEAASVAVERVTGEQIAATALVARDVDLQAHDERHREVADERVTEREAELVDAEMVAARALAAMSYPVPAIHAAAGPSVTPVGRRKAGRRGAAVEIHGPSK